MKHHEREVFCLSLCVSPLNTDDTEGQTDTRAVPTNYAGAVPKSAVISTVSATAMRTSCSWISP
jgi:hypothetical protein